MGDGNDVGILAGRLLQDGFKMAGSFVGQGGHCLQQPGLVEPEPIKPTGEFRNQLMVAQDDVGMLQITQRPSAQPSCPIMAVRGVSSTTPSAVR